MDDSPSRMPADDPQVPRYSRASDEVILSVIQDDIRHVHVRATASLALAAVFVTQIPLGKLQALPNGFRWATFLGVVALALAGVGYFHYTQLLNMARLEIVAPRIPDPVGSWDERFRVGPERRPILLYRTAQTLFVIGSVLLAAVLFKLFFP